MQRSDLPEAPHQSTEQMPEPATGLELRLRLQGGAPKKGKDKKGKKGKDKGDKGDKAPLEGGGESVEELKQKVAYVNAELDHEREERNYFQLERDKINTFWEITKKVSFERCPAHRSRERRPASRHAA